MPSNKRSTKKKRKNAKAPKARPCDTVLEDMKSPDNGSTKKICDTVLDGVPLKNRSANNHKNSTMSTERPNKTVFGDLPFNNISTKKNVDITFKDSSICSTKNRRLKPRDLRNILSDETIQGIKQGCVDKHEVAFQLVAMRMRESFRNKLATIGEKNLCLASSELAKLAFGASTMNSVGLMKSTNNEDPRVTIAVVNLAQGLFRAFCTVTPEDPCAKHGQDAVVITGAMEKEARDLVQIMKAYQQEHDRLLWGFTPEIIRLTGLPPMCHSPSFMANSSVFFSIMSCQLFGQDFRHQVGVEMMEAGAACIDIAAGNDHRRTSCWECGTECEKVQKCSGCKAARYCGPDCQLKSWKGGHNKSCESLKVQYQYLQKNAKVVAKALKAESIGPSCTIAPNPHIDRLFLKEMIHKLSFAASLVSIDSCMEFADKKGIEIMYKCIRDLASGGSHFTLVSTPRTEPGSSVDTKTGKPQSIQDIDEMEIKYVCKAVIYFLMDDPPSAEAKASMLNDMRKLHPRGEVMTVERFLDIYTAYDTWKDDAEDVAEDDAEDDVTVPAHLAWDHYFGDLFDMLRDGYHKVAISAMLAEIEGAV